MGPLTSFSTNDLRKIGAVVCLCFLVLSLCLVFIIISPHNLVSKAKRNLGYKPTTIISNYVSENPSKDASIHKKYEISNISKPICDVSGERYDTCDVAGDIRLQANSTTLFVHNASIEQKQWRIRPYACKGKFLRFNVKEWVLKPSNTTLGLPTCHVYTDTTAFVFSIGGLAGNLFHDFTDVLIPLYISTINLQGEVQFVVSDIRPDWIPKYWPILKQLTNYDIVDATVDDGRIRCYPRVIVGATFHKEFGIDPRKPPKTSMMGFRQMLSTTFGTKRTMITSMPRKRPSLLIISRSHSRRFLNLHDMIMMANNLGFETIVGDEEMSKNLPRFAKLVSTMDVMIGVHGAGIANMVFLPKRAVLVQVVPFGDLEWLASFCYLGGAKDLELKYLQYVIQEEESSLIYKYPRDHYVLRNVSKVYDGGFDAVKSVYLNEQDVSPNIGRLRGTLQKALQLLDEGENRRKV